LPEKNRHPKTDGRSRSCHSGSSGISPVIAVDEQRRYVMVKTALLVRLEAKPGKEADVESFLRGGLSIVNEEPATTAWFAIRMGPSTFGIFDAFPDEAGRQAHLSGRVAAALMAKASELLAQPPVIEKVDVLAAKLPG
jgi:quinol monooxygenase YgiN